MGKFATKMAVTPKRVKRPKDMTGPALSESAPDTINDAGGAAYSLSTKAEIAQTVLGSMLKGSYYQDATGELAKIQTLADKAEKSGELEFLAKAALYARFVHGLRSVSHVIGGELGDRARGATWKKPFYKNLVFRADDILEVLGYWNLRHKDFRHPNPMIRGFAERMASFTAYELAKYRGDGKSVSMVDAVNICHPKVGADHPIHLLMKGKLQAAETWEKKLSAAGNVEAEDGDKAEAVAEAKSEAWAELLSKKQLGYLACLRNLRNIVEQAPASLDDALELLVNPKAVANSKVFPFQFRKAYDELKGKNKVRAAIVTAADLAMANVPKFTGKTLIVVDDSGSMTSGGDTACIKIASLFAAVLAKANPDADYMQFSDDARYKDLDTVGCGLFKLAEQIEGTCKSGGTNFSAIFGKAKSGYDRIIILSDMQGWMSGDMQQVFTAYARMSKKVPYLYSFNLSAQGTTQFPEKQVCLLSGFSDKIFEIMAQAEQDPQVLVKEIEKVDLVKGIPKKKL